MSDTERRHYHRILFHSDITLECPDRAWSTQLINVSLAGVLLRLPDDFDDYDHRELKVTLPLGESGESIQMSVTASHREHDQLGCRWCDIDLESFQHLRRLIELNTEEAGVVERELSEFAED